VTQGPNGQGLYLVPSGGTTGKVLAKLSGTNGEFEYKTLTKSDVNLANVANLSPANLPVSSTTQSALDLKANLASPTFTGTVSGVTKSHVGLGNVPNLAAADLPVSSATQSALGLKANLASPSFTGTVTAPNTNLSSVSSATTSSVLYYNTTSKAVTFGAAPSGGSTSYTGGTSASVTSSSGNFRSGPGQVWNPSAHRIQVAPKSSENRSTLETAFTCRRESAFTLTQATLTGWLLLERLQYVSSATYFGLGSSQHNLES
jgi:hypothetical protein